MIYLIHGCNRLKYYYLKCLKSDFKLFEKVSNPMIETNNRKKKILIM